MSEPVASIEQIKRNAERAADSGDGHGANPYPVDSVAYVTWKQTYSNRVRFNEGVVA